MSDTSRLNRLVGNSEKPMQVFSISESRIWDKEEKEPPSLQRDEDIVAKYDARADRIVTETNREKLRNFADSLARNGYMDPRPFYQRRNRWDPERQSLLIESFLINIPIPPLFVYEVKPDIHEVLDGQQRITAIKAFYSNELKLTGLVRWPELNGRTYSKLPNVVRAGIDRRSISWIVVLNESIPDEEEELELKKLVFERLNTGGVKLSAQEIRNALYAGPFNDLLIRLSRLDEFREAWKLPKFSTVELKETPPHLLANKFYAAMEDLEVVLRFFALRHAEHYSRGMQGFLDLYMMKAHRFTDEDLVVLERLFVNTIQLCQEVFGELIFRPYVPKERNFGNKPQKAFADAVMVAASRFTLRREALVKNHSSIISDLVAEFEKDQAGVLVGRGNTKKDILARIKIVEDILERNSHI